MEKTRICWHGHHDCNSPLEFLTDGYAPRREIIKIIKAREETPEQIRLRLKLFKKVKGKLPAALNKAGAELDKARAEWGKARAGWGKVRAEWDRACAEWDRAIKQNMPAILKLHAKECGCGWTPECTNIFVYNRKNSD